MNDRWTGGSGRASPSWSTTIEEEARSDPASVVKQLGRDDTAGGGPAANLLGAHAYDIVFLDLDMPVRAADHGRPRRAGRWNRGSRLNPSISAADVPDDRRGWPFDGHLTKAHHDASDPSVLSPSQRLRHTSCAEMIGSRGGLSKKRTGKVEITSATAGAIIHVRPHLVPSRRRSGTRSSPESCLRVPPPTLPPGSSRRRRHRMDAASSGQFRSAMLVKRPGPQPRSVKFRFAVRLCWVVVQDGDAPAPITVAGDSSAIFWPHFSRAQIQPHPPSRCSPTFRGDDGVGPVSEPPARNPTGRARAPDRPQTATKSLVLSLANAGQRFCTMCAAIFHFSEFPFNECRSSAGRQP